MRHSHGTMVESLEGRRMLAGNVTVTHANFLVSILGDNKSNQIDIEAGTNFAGYNVIGLNGTKVNGAPSAFIATPGPENIKIDMGNGDDSVHCFPFAGIPFDAYAMDVDMGNGNDTVKFDNWACDTLNISTGNGGDDVRFTNLEVDSGFHLDLGNGPDNASFNGVIVLGGTDNVIGGHGPDVVDFSGLTAGSSFTVFLDGVEKLITA